MDGYVTVGSNRLKEAMAFFDALLAGLGIERLFDHPRGGAIYAKEGAFAFGVLGPENGKPATIGNGTMIALAAPSRKDVDRLHAKALSLGAANEGDPGVRGPDPDGPFYGAYFRDLDGNKFCFFKYG